MRADGFPNVAITDQDRAYRGSLFGDVRKALFANPYQRVWGAAGEPPLPIYQTTLASVLRGLLPLARRYLFRQATEREVDSRADMRWGADGKGYRRLLHRNSICLLGTWHITEATDYSGYFRQGSRALIVARYSTCCDETRRGRTRSLAMVGKLFPTTDPDHTTPLETANFITQQDLGGAYTDYVNDAELRNAPDTTAWRRGLGIPILILEGIVFGLVDRKTSMRQLYPIAELAKPAGEPTKAPTFMRLLVASEQPRIPGEALDFRDEIMAQIYDKGDPQPKRLLTFNVDVSDDGTTSGPSFRERRSIANWRRIGKIAFDAAVVSYNGDYVTHFNHPTWRDDQSDPATATRIDERKVRWLPK
ncbi:MAG TPA: hypothetical protein VK456_08980 [Xanthobacteraceae bacterium]|nr:hypothetical protein [Xanthobacteraceae bacterium]